jgi:DNA-directed RNA polymerase subunit RPC12/RpoP
MEWYKCPECGQKLFKITPDAVIKGIQIKCKQCRKLINVSHEPKDSNNGVFWLFCLGGKNVWQNIKKNWSRGATSAR